MSTGVSSGVSTGIFTRASSDLSSSFSSGLTESPSTFYTTVTSTWTNSITSTETHTAPSKDTVTVVVEVPSESVPCTTITSTWTGTTTAYTTVCVSDETTVIVQVPTTTTTTVEESGAGHTTPHVPELTGQTLKVPVTLSSTKVASHDESTNGGSDRTLTAVTSSTTIVNVPQSIRSNENLHSSNPGAPQQPAASTESGAEHHKTLNPNQPEGGNNDSTYVVHGGKESSTTVAEGVNHPTPSNVEYPSASSLVQSPGNDHLTASPSLFTTSAVPVASSSLPASYVVSTYEGLAAGSTASFSVVLLTIFYLFV